MLSSLSADIKKYMYKYLQKVYLDAQDIRSASYALHNWPFSGLLRLFLPKTGISSSTACNLL